MALFEGSGGKPALPVRGEFKGIAALADAGVKLHPGDTLFPAQVDDGALPVQTAHGLGGLGVAQVPKGHGGVDQGQKGDEQSVPAVRTPVRAVGQRYSLQIGQAQIEQDNQQGGNDRKKIGGFHRHKSIWQESIRPQARNFFIFILFYHCKL